MARAGPPLRARRLRRRRRRRAAARLRRRARALPQPRARELQLRALGRVGGGRAGARRPRKARWASASARHGGGWLLPRARRCAARSPRALRRILSEARERGAARVKSQLSRPDPLRVPTLEVMTRSLDALYARFGIDARRAARRAAPPRSQRCSPRTSTARSSARSWCAWPTRWPSCAPALEAERASAQRLRDRVARLDREARRRRRGAAGGARARGRSAPRASAQENVQLRDPQAMPSTCCPALAAPAAAQEDPRCAKLTSASSPTGPTSRSSRSSSPASPSPRPSRCGARPLHPGQQPRPGRRPSASPRCRELAARRRFARVDVRHSRREPRLRPRPQRQRWRAGARPALLRAEPGLHRSSPACSTRCSTRPRSTTRRVAAWEMRQIPYEHPKAYDPVTLDTPWVSGAAMLLRRSAFEDVGGFDPRIFMYGEDVDLSWRLRARGWRLRYLPRLARRAPHLRDAGEVKPLQVFGGVLTNLVPARALRRRRRARCRASRCSRGEIARAADLSRAAPRASRRRASRFLARWPHFARHARARRTARLPRRTSRAGATRCAATAPSSSSARGASARARDAAGVDPDPHRATAGAWLREALASCANQT